MKLSLLTTIAAFVVLPNSHALKPSKSGLLLTQPCLSTTDKRYDANFPKSLVVQNPSWKQYEGLWKFTATNFEGDGIPAQPQPHVPALNYQLLPYTRSEAVAFYNHTADGSRMMTYGYYFYRPAPSSFCNQTLEPPFQNVIGSGVCGVNGFVSGKAHYGTSTNEKEGELELFRSVESGALGIDVIDFDPPAKASWIDSSTLWGTTTIDGVFSQTHSYVFLNNNTAFASLSVIDLITSSRQTNYIAKMTRMDETEWIAAVEQTYKDYNIMEEDKIPVPFKDFSMDPEWYPAEKEWCGGVGSDPACVESPFQEPDAKLKTGPLVGFVILGLALFCVPMYGLYRYRLGQQVRRIKTCFIQGIAKNINIAPTPGALTHEKLLEEFQHMDKDNGGTIEKAELKQWMDEGKVGKISDSDFNVLWSALDIDGSGSVDFIEFCTFLSGCGEAFDEVYNHQQTMSKEQKLKFASQRFSTRSLANNGCISNDIEDNS
ncbi:predicted protein [Phaeodactylum tricornutum CCAP 1055/1]|uniref:EF-hand domain-containing protein n=2 Tax=Phaeodactylum tricornutum TaxID=2850 RepID=B7G6M4_PHATC|nr:predicted protein [Phaeodactylum tricornutum CCAP 1055/1]EEC45620.1 predicted protein [Phaeodactylum tricornutum CCAP 1055/1]|eukprot:XP_002182884.1 predicted protein [Phaeodactylum tricornutum CCAP 1055/1]